MAYTAINDPTVNIDDAAMPINGIQQVAWVGPQFGPQPKRRKEPQPRVTNRRKDVEALVAFIAGDYSWL